MTDHDAKTADRILNAKKLVSLLRLNGRRPVGVKLAYCKDEYDSFDAVNLTAPLKYCVAVSSASLGYSLKFTRENSGCRGSTYALGFEPPSEDFYTGKSAHSLGLFTDDKTAASVSYEFKILKRPLYGVIVKPLEKFTEGEPDNVIVITRPREMMRLLQGVTCALGMQSNMNISGNQALCVECTAYPVITGRPNLSLLCSGTRYIAGWDESETAMGIPYSVFGDVVQGVLDTADGTETDERKAEIASALNALGCSHEFRSGWAYYLRE